MWEDILKIKVTRTEHWDTKDTKEAYKKISNKTSYDYEDIPNWQFRKLVEYFQLDMQKVYINEYDGAKGQGKTGLVLLNNLKPQKCKVMIYLDDKGEHTMELFINYETKTMSFKSKESHLFNDYLKIRRANDQRSGVYFEEILRKDDKWRFDTMLHNLLSKVSEPVHHTIGVKTEHFDIPITIKVNISTWENLSELEGLLNQATNEDTKKLLKIWWFSIDWSTQKRIKAQPELYARFQKEILS